MAGPLWVLFGWQVTEWLNRRPFDAGAWQAAKEKWQDPVRQRMVDDLLRRHRLVGMTRERVVELLGESDTTDYFRDWDLVYWLGMERSWISIDSEWLVLRLNAQSAVTEARLVTD